MNVVHRSFFLLALLTAVLSSAVAQRDLQNIPDPSPRLQEESFEVAEGFEINLFASDPMIAKPVQMNWDAEGRLWLVSSRVYPHLEPGQEADDEILVIEDTDGDGRADKKTMFADGLLIPTGLIPADGGVYVANSTEILFMRDTDGDGRADERKIVFSGFGTEDTHHLIHTFRGGPEGMIYFNQSIYIHSHVETPWGVRRLLGGGAWHFRPETRRLEVFCKGFVNPWGHAFDPWGQSFFTDGAYGEGINYVFPGSVWVTSPGAQRTLQGLNPGQPKHCGLAMLSGRHLPESWRGQLLTNDFRGHRVNRFEISENGSGYASRQLGDLVWTKHVAFRPIDVQMGPDGAIYIADWYNPIIQHGEVDFRDPRRDQERGRIWRVTAKDRPLLERPKIVGASVPELLELLKVPEDWTRYFAKRELRRLGPETVRPALETWVADLENDEEDPLRERHRLEGLWVYQNMNLLPDELLYSLFASSDHRVRAAAVRSIYHWHESLPDVLDRLRTAVADPHPQVRLEAVNALRQLGTAEAFVAAMRVMSLPMDKNLDFALWLASRDLEDAWLPAFQSGELHLGGAEQVQFALRAIENPSALRPLIEAFAAGELGDEAREESLDLVAELGSAAELAAVAKVLFDPETALDVKTAGLRSLVTAARRRDLRPEGNLQPVAAWLGTEDEALQALAAEAVGRWGLEDRRADLESLARTTESMRVAAAAYSGLASLGGDDARSFLKAEVSDAELPVSRRVSALGELIRLDLNAGAERASALLAEVEDAQAAAPVFDAFLTRKDGPAALAKSLSGKTLAKPVAYLGLQRANASGNEAEALIEALSSAAGLESITQGVSEEEMAKLVGEVLSQGDPARGEAVYRLEALQCQVCHALGGAGGVLGPDLISIGSSAPIDYIIDSLLEPSKKIKEGFHMTVVTTKSGNVFSGYVVREDERQMVIRDVTGQETVVSQADVAGREISPISMMPAGLTASLRRDDFIHLVRFLSELGKEGDYKIGGEPVVRTWRVLNFTDAIAEQVRQGDQRFFAQPDDLKEWLPAYSRVAGDLPVDAIPSTRRWLVEVAPVRFEIDVSAAGQAGFRPNAREGVRLFVGTREVRAADGVFVTDVSAGRHWVTLVLAPDAFPPDALRVEKAEGEGFDARLQFTTGP